VNRARWIAFWDRRTRMNGVTGNPRLSSIVLGLTVGICAGLMAASHSGVPWVHHSATAVIRWLNTVDNAAHPPR